MTKGYRAGRWGRSTRISINDAHVKYFVSGDAYDVPCLWADQAHAANECDTCAADNRFMWGPTILLVKDDTEPVVWVATLRTLLNK